MLAKNYILLSDFVLKSNNSLEERLVDLLHTNGGRTLFDSQVQIYEIHNFNGFSGYNYWVDGSLVGQLHMATMCNGNFVIYKRIFLEGQITEIYDYYNSDGKIQYDSHLLDGELIQYSSINMEPSSPFINHFYNVLYNEYVQASLGTGQTKRIQFIEGLLQKRFKDQSTHLSANDGINDFSLKLIIDEIHQIECDPILTWNERQSIFKSLKEKRSKIMSTKKRVHKMNFFNYNLAVLVMDFKTRMQVIKRRPFNNLQGISYKYSIGKVLWFFRTVKENLGISVAMAIYGPFTFFFITQPMNPYAMKVVGSVRGTYIELVKSIEDIDKQTSPKNIAQIKTLKDSISLKQSALKKISPSLTLPASSITWDDRMSNFKQMEIAYNADMVFAARMGRLEQMDSQFNFPLTAESAWHETQRYIKAVRSALKYNKELNPTYVNFLKKEITRARSTQVYIWNKMAQFFIDYPYIVIDQKGEQDERDFYVGRSFIFMQEMTEVLGKLKPTSMPETNVKVQKLAQFYSSNKINGESVLDNLKKNSKVFSLKTEHDTDEFRTYMKRHWEILFLQQNKKQEAASYGLQTYTWSVKNALWTMQSLYSAKREEINKLTYKFNSFNKNVNASLNKPDAKMDQLLESLMHLLTIEYVSIKKEFAKNLDGDNEVVQRAEQIGNLKEYLIDRDALYKL